MSEHDDRHEDREHEPLWGTPEAAARADDEERRRTPGERPDPRLRPPDPAGTQPKYNPDDLLPTNVRARQADASAGVAEADVVEDVQPQREHDGDLLPERVAAAEAPAVAAAPRESRFAPRFQFALGGLLAIGVAAVALTALIAIGTGSSSKSEGSGAAAWSSWRPSPGGGDGPTQIANHIGHQYRLPNGKQLVAVTGGPMEIAGLPLTVALRESAAQGGDIKLIEGKGVLYRLCGLGPKCAIDEGKASTRRHLLLRREALELALYSFRYLDGVDEAVVLMPPRKGQDPSQALFFQKRDLQGSVQRPLSATLVPQTPSVGSVAQSPDATLVNTITTKTLFQFSLTQANQDARAFLVLEPLQGG